MAKPIVYGTPLSTYVRTTRMTLLEKGVDYDHVDVGVLDGECKGPEHVARNPFGKVPAVEHDGFLFYETGAIVRYIDQVFPDPPLAPAEPRARAGMNQVISIHDYHGYDSIILDVVAYFFFADFVGGQDEDRLARGKERAALCLSEWERIMGEGGFLAGDDLSLADLYVAPSIFYLSLTPVADELLSPHPRFQEWWAAISTRDSMKATEPDLG